MINEENTKRFIKTIKKGPWRKRYEVVQFDNFKMNNLEEDEWCTGLLIKTAQFDPCYIVRSEAVKTCNKLRLSLDGKKIVLKKLRTLNNTLIAKNIDIKNIILGLFLKADIPFFPRKGNVSPHMALSEDEWNRFYELFKDRLPKVYDLLDGHFAQPDSGRYKDEKNKIQAVINSNDRTDMSNYLYGTYCCMSKEFLYRFCRKHGVSIPDEGGNNNIGI